MGIDHRELMTLIIGYTCVGVFVATALITLFGLVGVLKVERGVLTTLLKVLVVEIVGIGLAIWLDFINLDRKPLEAKIETLVAETTRPAEALAMPAPAPSASSGPGGGGVASAPAPTLKPRVYIHIAKESDRAPMQKVSQSLAERGTIAVDIERLTLGPSHTELRYFRTAEAAEAQNIAEQLAQLGVAARLRYVSGFENSRGIRPRHYELWVAE